MKKAVFKVPNGKLLKIFLQDDGVRISSIKITGDFFAHPEENIEQLETALQGILLDDAVLRAAVNEFLARTPTRFFGLDAESLISTILNAV